MNKTKVFLSTLLVGFSLNSYGNRPLTAFNYINSPEGPVKAHYIIDGEERLFEGDILVEEYNQDKANSTRFGKWKNGVVPYVIDSAIPDVKKIYDAIDEYHLKTSVRWIPRTNEKDYVYFKYNGEKSCSSWIGRFGGKQTIRVPNWCDKGGVIHEMMHAIGFYHEQSRRDRNKYIKIKWRNIKPIYAFNFFIAPFSILHGIFDFNSIMLYPPYNGFAIDESKPTITKRNGENYIPNTTELSELDVKAIEERYRLK